MEVINGQARLEYMHAVQHIQVGSGVHPHRFRQGGKEKFLSSSTYGSSGCTDKDLNPEIVSWSMGQIVANSVEDGDQLRFDDYLRWE